MHHVGGQARGGLHSVIVCISFGRQQGTFLAVPPGTRSWLQRNSVLREAATAHQLLCSQHWAALGLGGLQHHLHRAADSKHAHSASIDIMVPHCARFNRVNNMPQLE